MTRGAHLVRRLWNGESGPGSRVLSAALVPAEFAYRLAMALRNLAYDHGVAGAAGAGIPVISVGNIAVGGSGKTPFTNWLALRLRTRGELPAIIHGGYADDEPALHRTWAPHIPVIVERDRVRAVDRARSNGATVALLDDAFQHRRLSRDLDIVLVAVERWSDPLHLLPRGPWREPATALRRADLIVCVRRTADQDASVRVAASLATLSARPVIRVVLRAEAWHQDGREVPAPAGPALAVAALAEPELFGRNARAAGANVAAELFFADHHEYDASDVERIRGTAGGRCIVTSAKDWVKLRRHMDPREVWVLTQDLVMEDGTSVLDDLLDRVTSTGSGSP